jgi:AP-1 complex subunit beta-1
VTLLAESEPEVQYIALRNISLIMSKYPAVLAGEVKVFFCKYNDPVYVKLEKLEALIHLVSEKTADAVLSELKEYASEIDLEFVRKAVRCIGRFAIRVEAAADKCVSALLELIETKVSYVVQEAVVVMRDIFRRFPGRFESVITALCDNLEALDEPEAKAAMVWILGQYAERIDNSGELIDSFLATFLEESYPVQLELLTASVKYFLKVKNASHGTLVKVLNMCTEESENPDLRDRAFFHWRLLSIDPEACRKMMIGAKPLIVDDVGNEVTGELLQTLIACIGTLASVYHVVPNSFVVRREKVLHNKDDEGDTEEEEREKVVAKMREKLHPHPQVQVDNRVEGKTGNTASDDSDSDSSSDSSVSSSSDSSSSDRTAPDLKVASLQVLPPSAPAGSKGTSGLGVEASISKVGEQRFLFLSLKNATSSVLSQFAIQFNKNSFGLTPRSTSSIDNLKELGPGQVSQRLSVMLDANKLNSGSPPSEQQLSVQVALRTNLDIFYFVVPYDLHLVLERKDRGGITKTNLSASWDALASSEKTVLVPSYAREKLVARMLQGGFSSVGDLIFSAVTVNKLLLLVKIDEESGRCAVRASNVHLVPHACVLLTILFGTSSRRH